MQLVLLSNWDVAAGLGIMLLTGLGIGLPVGGWIQTITRPWCCEGCAAELARRRGRRLTTGMSRRRHRP